MALRSGLQPKGFSEIKTPDPKPLVAIGGPVPSFEGGDLVPNPAPQPVYFVGGINASFTKGAAVANATDAASAITQLNALLASLRAAGIIAT